MHILLVNTNPVVSRLISLNTRDDATIQVDEIDGSEMIPGEWYDVVFLDEKCCDIEVMGAYLQKVSAGRKILFSSQKENSVEGIDRVILKPFLPSEITAVLQSILQNEEMTTEKEEEPLTLGESEEVNEDSEKEEILILDGQEIELIKQLLLDEELEAKEIKEPEVEPENVIVEAQDRLGKRKKPKKKKKSKAASKTKEQKVGFEENLLEALVEMKPKKIRKLLEGAEVSIMIRFPKGV